MKIIFNFLFIFCLFIISIIDFKKKIIPNSLNLFIMGLNIVRGLLLKLNFENFLMGMGIFPILLLFIYGYGSDIYKKELIGFGDIKLMASIGFYNGYTSFLEVIIFYNILSFLGIVAYIFMKILLKRENLEIAFAPEIVLSYFILKIMENIL